MNGKTAQVETPLSRHDAGYHASSGSPRVIRPLSRDLSLDAEARWLRDTARRIRHLLRRHGASRYLYLAPTDDDSSPGDRLLTVAEAHHRLECECEIWLTEPKLGYRPSLGFGLSFFNRKPGLKLRELLTPYFGVVPITRLRHQDPPAPANRPVLVLRPDGFTGITVELGYVVEPTTPAPSLLVTDIAYFFDSAARLASGRSPTRVRQYGSRRGPRPRSICGRGAVLSTHQCPRCGGRLWSFDTECLRCDWPRPVREREQPPSEIADT